MPGRRRRGAVQERVSRRLLAPPWHPDPRAPARTHPRLSRLGQPVRAAVERDRKERAGAVAQRAAVRHRSTADAAGMDVAVLCADRWHAPSPACRGAPGRHVGRYRRALQRHLYELLLPGDRDGGTAGARDRRARRRAGAARLLRPAADLPGSARGGPAAGRLERRRAVSAGRARRADRVFRTQLSLGDPRRRAVTAQRRGAASRAAGGGPRGAVRGVPREREWEAGRVRIDLGDGPPQILLHGHCHQKAMGRLAPAKALLGRIPGATVVDLDAGCCGMAGSFGYAREHFDVSRAIGERRLLPAARTLRRWCRAGRKRDVVPPSGRRLHRRPGAPRGGAASVAASRAPQ